MDNFVVSARKYRPVTFDTVVGQSAITGTLRNAIDNNHLAQAFLFCGPRGVGKTSCARILAHEINKHAAKEKGEETETDFSLNIFELDAASNNSVDDIRNLTDQVRFAPQVGSYKVYIIDEVHMLSQQAFNAFLKTLEEPPPHAIFILATTEKHKILPTILSRCQIFDFQRITVRDIAVHLQSIATQEGVQADPEGLNIIAEKADGAMRDALSMFDQLVSFSGNSLTYESVVENLNVLDYDYYFTMVNHVIAHQIPASLIVYDEILNKGFDGHNFIVGLAQHLRNLMMCNNPKTLGLIETSDSIRQRYEEQSKLCSVRFIFKALEVLNDADVQYKSSKNKRLLVEFALMKLCAITEKKSNNDNNEQVTHKASAPQSSPPIAKTTSDVKPPSQVQAPIDLKEPKSKYTPANEQPVPDPEPVSARNTAIEVQQSSSKDHGKVQESIDVTKTQQRKKFMAKFQSASVSISAGLVEEEAPTEAGSLEENNTADTIRPDDTFTQKQLMQAWKEYSTRIREAGRESFYSTLTLSDPEILENHQVKLKIKNSAQELELNREKGDMLEFLREKLNNFFIEISFEIEQSDQPTALYTNSQKFEAMVKKNPNLGKLSGNLNLDIY